MPTKGVLHLSFPSFPSQLTLAGILQIETSLGSHPLHDIGPFHHLRERLKPGTKEKCRKI